MSDDFQPIGLGDRARDRISGFTGIVDSVSCYLKGSMRMGMRPEALDKDGMPGLVQDFDQLQLVLVEKGVHRPYPVAAANPPVALGDRVKDKITGFSGIVTSTTDFLYGCRRIGVRPEELHDGSPISREYFDETELTILQRGVQEAAVLAPAAAPEPERLRAAGGPPREGAGFRR